MRVRCPGRLLVLGVALAALAAPGAHAQEPVEGRSPYLEMDLDSLVGEYQAASRAASEARRRWREARQDSLRARVDTVSVGPLRVVARRDQIERAADHFREAWEGEFARAVGDSLRPVREPLFGLEVRQSGEDRIILEGPSHVVSLNPMSRWWMEDLTDGAAQELGKALALGLPERWRYAVAHRVRVGVADWADIYRRVATAPSRAARECLDGVARECWVAMNLLEIREPLLGWYSPEDRREVVRGSDRRMSGPEGVEHYDACVTGGSDEACVAFMRLRPPRAPLDDMVLRSLVSLALERGGGGSYARLLASGDLTLREALGRAAGMEPDALVMEWVERIRDARPRRRTEATEARWTTVIWIMILAGLAMRSTRWRLA